MWKEGQCDLSPRWKKFQSPCEDSDVESIACWFESNQARFQSPCEDSNVESGTVLVEFSPSNVSIPLRGFRCGKSSWKSYPSIVSCFNPLARIPMWKAQKKETCSAIGSFNPLARIPMWKGKALLEVEFEYVSIPLRGFRCGKFPGSSSCLPSGAFQSPCEDSDVEREVSQGPFFMV